MKIEDNYYIGQTLTEAKEKLEDLYRKNKEFQIKDSVIRTYLFQKIEKSLDLLLKENECKPHRKQAD